MQGAPAAKHMGGMSLVTTLPVPITAPIPTILEKISIKKYCPKVTIEDNVWIGSNAVICAGVTVALQENDAYVGIGLPE